jgi:hypothetical protein
MDWKLILFLIILCIIAWYIWQSVTSPLPSVEIKAIPKSQQKSIQPKEAIDPIAPYFTPAREVVPTDETMELQTCPFSKPYSTDLPVVDMPRCTVLSERSYKMSEFKH